MVAWSQGTTRGWHITNHKHTRDDVTTIKKNSAVVPRNDNDKIKIIYAGRYPGIDKGVAIKTTSTRSLPLESSEITLLIMMQASHAQDKSYKHAKQ